MRPYLAILKDSFREAMVSRVLWVLLVLIGLFLLLLVGFGIDELGSSRVRPTDLVDATALVRKIKQAADAGEPSPGKQVWNLLDQQSKQVLEDEEAADNIFLATATMYSELNRIVERPDLYAADAWQGVKLNDEAQELIARGPRNLEDAEQARLNRLLLSAAYPVELAPPTGTEVYVTYYTATLAGPWQLSREGIVNFCLQIFTDYFLGVAGVLIAILVTASMIPRTLEAGAIDLLLSKPVSRSLVFLTKFAGGCAFILINAAVFIGGMWLIIGLRIGIWHSRLLLCIPLILFLFMIYYAVSALASVLWQNAIISVFVTVAFWAMCFGVWGLMSLIENFSLSGREIVRILPKQGTPLVVVAGSAMASGQDMQQMLADRLQEWNPDRNRWQVASLRRGEAPRVPPGTRVPFPGGTASMFILEISEDESRFVFVSAEGIERLQQKAGPAREQLLGMGTRGIEPFENVGPELNLNVPFAAAMAADGRLAVFDGRQLLRFDLDEDEQYEVSGQVEFSSDERAVMAYGGDRVLLALGDGQLRLYEAERPDAPRIFRPRGTAKPQQAYATADGRWFAVLFNDKHLWLYDAQNDRDLSGDVSGQGRVSAVAISAKNEVFVADSYTRVTHYALDDMRRLARLQPDLSGLEWIYWYPLRTIYLVFPKPGELGHVVQYVLTGDENRLSFTDDLEASRGRLNVWQPLWSNLAFVAVMLALGCWYVARKDF